MLLAQVGRCNFDLVGAVQPFQAPEDGEVGLVIPTSLLAFADEVIE
jgi:hypothetical protein